MYTRSVCCPPVSTLILKSCCCISDIYQCTDWFYTDLFCLCFGTSDPSDNSSYKWNISHVPHCELVNWKFCWDYTIYISKVYDMLCRSLLYLFCRCTWDAFWITNYYQWFGWLFCQYICVICHHRMWLFSIIKAFHLGKELCDVVLLWHTYSARASGKNSWQYIDYFIEQFTVLRSLYNTMIEGKYLYKLEQFCGVIETAGLCFQSHLSQFIDSIHNPKCQQEHEALLWYWCCPLARVFVNLTSALWGANEIVRCRPGFTSDCQLRRRRRMSAECFDEMSRFIWWFASDKRRITFITPCSRA